MRRFPFVCLLLSAAATAQQTWVVDSYAPAGGDFMDLPAAVAAAAPGDTILVTRRSLRYAPTVIDKPLSIIGFNAQATPSATLRQYALFEGRFVITGIPAGERVVLASIESITGIASQDQGGLEILDCDGQVVIEDCDISSINWYPMWTPDHKFRIHDSADVVFRGSEIYLFDSGVEVVNSNLLVQSTLIAPLGVTTPAVGDAGMILTNSTVTLVGSIVRGVQQTVGGAHEGAELHDSLLRVGPHTLLAGAGTGWSQADAYVAPVADSSVVEVDPSADLRSDSGLSPAPVTRRIPAVFHSWTVPTWPFGVTVVGPEGGFALLALGEYGPPVPTPFGELRVEPGSADLLQIVPLSAIDGDYEWTFTMPSGVPSGFAFAFQALTLSPAGEWAMTEPSPFSIAWEFGLPPP